MKIEKIKIDQLKAAEYNPRRANEKEVEDLKESLKRFGFVEPIVVNSAPKRKDIIIGGHFRVRVAKEMKIKEVPVVYVNIPDIKKEKELNLRLNRNLGQWDLKLLKGFDIDLLKDVGFESSELDRIFEQDILEDNFDADVEYAGIKKPKAKIGDLYLLGKHRLLCGDSIREEDVGRLMEGIKADMVFLDPPYNVNYKGKGKNTSEGILGDKQTEEKFIEFSESWVQRIKEALKEGGVYYICSGYSSYPTFLYALRVNQLYFSQPIIWVKNNTSYGWNDYRYKHEMLIKGKKKKEKQKKAIPILYGWNEGKHFFIETREEADVWEIKRRASNIMVHPTQKPIELCGRAIRNSSKRDEIVLDLFGGSGTTLISAEKEGRKAYLMELDPKYVDMIIKRWEAYTKKKAIKLK